MISKSRLRGWVEDARSDAREGPVTVVGRLLRFAVLAAKKFNRDNCFQRASALGFATLISLIPLLVLFFSLAGAFGEGDKIIAWVRDTGFRYLAPDFQKDLDEFLVQNISKSAFAQGKTGLVYFGAVVGLLLAAFGMASTAERYMNVIFEAPRKRSYLQKLMTFWVVLTVSPFFIVLSLWVGEWAFRDGSFVSDLRRAAPFLGTAVDLLTPTIIGFLGFTSLYLALPAATVRTKSAAFGGAAAVVLWEVVRRSFFLYVERQATVTSLYGKLAALPLFLVWIYIIWVVVLFGATLAFVHQHQGALHRRERSHRRGGRKHSMPGLALAYLKRLADAHAEGREPPDLPTLTAAWDADGVALKEIAESLADDGWIVEDARATDRYVLAKAPDLIDRAAVAAKFLETQFPAEFDAARARRVDLSKADPEAQMAKAWSAALAALSGPAPEPNT
jgi:membrane protein